MTIERIRELPTTSTGAQQVLVRKGDDYYVVSSVVAPFTGFETLVFPADEDGNITSWGDVAGGRGRSQNEAIADLDSREESNDG